jgi:hypothetical protein
MGWIVFTMNVILAGTVFAVALSTGVLVCLPQAVRSRFKVAIQLGGGVNLRTGAVAGDSTESTWWTAGKKAHAQWEQQVVRRKTRIAQIALRLDRWGRLKRPPASNAETKIEELAERKLRFDKPELTQEWDKIQRRERQASIPTIESTQSLGQDLEDR